MNSVFCKTQLFFVTGRFHRMRKSIIHFFIIMGIFDYSIKYRYFVDGEIREEVLTGHVVTTTVGDRLGDIFAY